MGEVYKLDVCKGSGYNGANWLVVLDDGRKFNPLYSFLTKRDAEDCREEMLRGFIRQASVLSNPSSERR